MTDTDDLKRRIQPIVVNKEYQGKCVLYVMSRDQRVADNHTLLAAQKHAMAKQLPLCVVFCLQAGFGYRAREQYEFMLQGLREVETDLRKLHIPFMLLLGDRFERLQGLLHHTDPDGVYLDFSPLRGQRKLVAKLKDICRSRLYIVDTHNIVPVWLLADKKQVGAYTLRPKMHKVLESWLVEPEAVVSHPFVWPGLVRSIDELQPMIDELLDTIQSNGTKTSYISGAQAAQAHLESFLSEGLLSYASSRNDPLTDAQSGLSAYLHFGQISALRITLELRRMLLRNGSELHLLLSPKMPTANAPESSIDGAHAFAEELIVRRELADNFCYYELNYDKLDGVPLWAQQSLAKHAADPREFIYSYEELRDGETHDDAWNAAQLQMRATGKVHGYMRMYWAKKVLEWTPNAETAINYLIQLNDYYSLDGGDPNGYTGILWSVAGVHDRPWFEREVYGVIRYMNYAGLKRKFAVDDYCKKWLKS